MSENAYSTANYGAMMRDRTRIDGYISALRKVIVPGETTVLELGTGTGVVAIAAARAGAKQVYAVEPNPSIELAREIVELNGIEGIEFIQAMSTDIDLPHADVLISDMRGVTPLLEGHIPSIVDARRRLLKAGGALIARRDHLFAAPVQADNVWPENIGHWDDNPVGVDMLPAKRVTSNNIFHFDSKPADLLAEPVEFATLEFETIESPHVAADISFAITQDGTMHGLSVWFDSQLDSEICLSNAPGLPLLAYGRPFFPVLEPFEVRAGERMEVSIGARLVRGAYLWTWTGGVAADPSRRFDQSTWGASDVTLQDLQRLRTDAKPRRSNTAAHLHFVLGRMNGQQSLRDIAEELVAEFDDVNSKDGLVFVSEVVAEHGSTA